MSERSRRRCVLRKTALPDATHYVGYVEDEETPEMIMKKFEELERIRAAAGSKPNSAADGSFCSTAAADAGPSSTATQGAAYAAVAAADEGPLDQEQLYAVFKATSMYNVKSLLSNNEALMGDAGKQQDRGTMSDLGNVSGSEDELVAELRGFWSDDDWGKTKKHRSKASKSSGSSKASDPKRRSKALQRNQRSSIITQYNRDTNAFIRRRMRVLDPDAIQQLRVPPPPLPLSWGRAILPYNQRLMLQAAAEHTGTAADAATTGAQEAAAPAETGATAAVAVQPRGLIHRQHALPASRNCDPSSSSALGPGQPLPADACEVHTTLSIASFAFSSLRAQHYQAVLINTGWEVRQQQQLQQQQTPSAAEDSANSSSGNAGVPSWQQYSSPECVASSSSSSGNGLPDVVQRLAAVPIQQLCPKGFIMIWVNKEHLSAVVKLMSRWGFSYVENLTWVLLHPNHSVLRLPYPHIQRSHITLYIFRKEGEGRDIELRHQRNPDVVFDCVRAVEGREWDVPAEIFSTIETLLPTGKGLFLELWAATEAGRAGWTHIVEQQEQHQLAQ